MKLQDLETEVDQLEEAAFQADIIRSFESRGWALYECPSIFTFDSLLSLQPIVEMGREKVWLKHKIKYILLPLNEKDNEWDVIRDLSYMIMSQGRGPFFVDMESKIDSNGNKYVEPIARYLLDSVELDPPFILLHFDRRMSNTLDPEKAKISGNTIELHLSGLWKVRKQLMMALRRI